MTDKELQELAEYEGRIKMTKDKIEEYTEVLNEILKRVTSDSAKMDIAEREVKSALKALSHAGSLKTISLANRHLTHAQGEYAMLDKSGQILAIDMLRSHLREEMK